MNRGFKSEARKIASSVRRELGLARTAPLDVWELAEWLAVPVLPLSSFHTDAKHAVRYFGIVDQSVFSAVTVFDGPKRLIVHNDYHSAGRQASDVGHELSRGLLMHDPAPVLDGRGCRYWSKEIEDEANWLSGVLLVPDEAALSVIRRRIPLDAAATMYGVSKQMMNFRINVSGARKRVRRYRN